MVASPSAFLSSFLYNLERILASCSQLYINCLAILLFIETCSKWAFKMVTQYCLYCDIVLFYLFWDCFFFLVCLIVWQCYWTILCMVIKCVHKWLGYCSHAAWLTQQFLCHLLWPHFYPLLSSVISLFQRYYIDLVVSIVIFIYYIFSWLCITYSFTWSSHLLLFCGGRG